MPAAAATAHDFSFTGIDGADLRLADYKGRVVLLGQYRIYVRLYWPI